MKGIPGVLRTLVLDLFAPLTRGLLILQDGDSASQVDKSAMCKWDRGVVRWPRWLYTGEMERGNGERKSSCYSVRTGTDSATRQRWWYSIHGQSCVSIPASCHVSNVNGD